MTSPWTAHVNGRKIHVLSCNIDYQIPRVHVRNKPKYRKIPKISPSMYKPPKTGNAKNPPLNLPSKYKLQGACTWKIFLKYKVKESKNGKLKL